MVRSWWKVGQAELGLDVGNLIQRVVEPVAIHQQGPTDEAMLARQVLIGADFFFPPFLGLGMGHASQQPDAPSEARNWRRSAGAFVIALLLVWSDSVPPVILTSF